jgi:hypothetical protein
LYRFFARLLLSSNRSVVQPRRCPARLANSMRFWGWGGNGTESYFQGVRPRTLYEIERTKLSRRRSRHPARAALAHLARTRTIATNAVLAAVLGVSREESVPNFTRRFQARLAADANISRQLRSLEAQLDGS